MSFFPPTERTLLNAVLIAKPLPMRLLAVTALYTYDLKNSAHVFSASTFLTKQISPSIAE